MNTFTSTPSDLGDTARRAYAHLLERGAATPESVRAALGVSQRQVQEALAELTDHRLATAEAADQGGQPVHRGGRADRPGGGPAAAAAGRPGTRQGTP